MAEVVQKHFKTEKRMVEQSFHLSDGVTLRLTEEEAIKLTKVIGRCNYYHFDNLWRALRGVYPDVNLAGVGLINLKDLNAK